MRGNQRRGNPGVARAAGESQVTVRMSYRCAMASAMYALFRRAIRERKLITCTYQGKRREDAHRTSSASRTGSRRRWCSSSAARPIRALPPGGEWRCFALKDVVDAAMRDGEWHTGGTHRTPQACIGLLLMSM